MRNSLYRAVLLEQQDKDQIAKVKLVVVERFRRFTGHKGFLNCKGSRLAASVESQSGSTLQTEVGRGRLYSRNASRDEYSHSSESNASEPAGLRPHIGLRSAVEAVPNSCALLLLIQVGNQGIDLSLSRTSCRHILSPQVKALQDVGFGDAQPDALTAPASALRIDDDCSRPRNCWHRCPSASQIGYGADSECPP